MEKKSRKARRSLLLHGAIISFIFISLIYSIGLFTGLAPVAPESHDLIHSLVKRNPSLNTAYYQEISSELYLSINDVNHLYIDWDMMYPKEMREAEPK